MGILDISTPIYNDMPVFPGDRPVRVARTRTLKDGDPYNLSEISIGSHTGTHIDPPVHFLPDGASVDRIDLAVLNGPCEVVELGRGLDRVGADALEHVPRGTDRILFRTPNSARWGESEAFFPDYVALDLDAADAVIARGVRLVGIDALSIERPESNFAVHRRLLAAPVLILEGLRLAEVPAGRYQLRCLPLRIQGGDGGPARAVLLPA